MNGQKTATEDGRERRADARRRANRARYKATVELVARHRAEFDVLYAQEAELEGVQPIGRRLVMAELAEVEPSLRVRCSHCGASAGERCRKGGGGQAAPAHTARLAELLRVGLDGDV